MTETTAAEGHQEESLRDTEPPEAPLPWGEEDQMLAGGRPEAPLPWDEEDQMLAGGRPSAERVEQSLLVAVAELDTLTEELLALADALYCLGDGASTFAASRIAALVRKSVERVCAQVP